MVEKKHIKISYIILGVIGLLVAGFFLRVAIWEHDYLQRMEGSERHTPETVVVEEEEEVEEEPPATEEVVEYIVAANKPRYLTIPSLGISNARILEVGKKANNEMQTPLNIWDAGWYTGSALPGTNSTAIINGHGGSNGLFLHLPKIAIGAEIRIEMGDGRLFTYTVVDTARKALGDEANDYMYDAAISPTPGVGSLTLITCDGDYWLQSKTFSHRFFTRAILKN